MNRLSFLTVVVFAAVGMTTIGCADSQQTSSSSDQYPAGKGDRWNEQNDPSRFQKKLVREYWKLPKKGEVQKSVWPGGYWPTKEGGINHRWQGEDTLSPVEKYDKAFNGWTPGENFDQLKPYDSDTCEWEPSYYEKLGPAATAIAKGTEAHKMYNGKDDDGDGQSDRKECEGQGVEPDRDGIRSWYGSCNAWTAAAIMEKEPLAPVTVDGVRFSVSDIKALIVNKYKRSVSYVLGERCRTRRVSRNENGRIEDRSCRDTNAGSFHLIATNFLGMWNRPFAMDRTRMSSVWNHPVVGYEIKQQKKVGMERVQQLLDSRRRNNSGALNPKEKNAIVKAANRATIAALEEKANLSSDAVEAIRKHRQKSGSGEFQNVEELKQLSDVGRLTLDRLLEYAQSQGWLPKPEASIYKYNEDAEQFAEVKMTLEYVGESTPSTEPRGPNLDEYIEKWDLHYLLELDANGKIIGGEWIGNDRPDFLWVPTQAGGGADSINIRKVRELIRKSRQKAQR